MASPGKRTDRTYCSTLVRSGSPRATVDRLGRSLQHLVELLNELQALHCNLYLHQQAIDTTTPSGKAMFQTCGVFEEFERAMIVERVNSGLARAKAKGVKLGRGNKKDGERSADEERWGMSRAELEKRILRLYKGGMGILRIGRELGIGSGTVQGVLRPLRRAQAGEGAQKAESPALRRKGLAWTRNLLRASQSGS
jgi:DNA invertase Pin-like site-specific DNA recombinase